MPEADFAAAIQRNLALPGTCGVGYNSLRFDDEVTRNLLYRNFFDPYAREWQNGNSRWDLIDTVRLAHALRPEGIAWPRRDDVASFRLEHLTAANGIEHAGAHNALTDVLATIALARLVKERQPRLFDYALTLRAKQRVEALLATGEPLLHVSVRYPAELGCIAPVLPVARHPANANGVIVFDLRQDPGPLLALSAEQVHARLFAKVADLPDEAQRIPLKTVHTNRCPILAPMTTLSATAAARWAIDAAGIERHARQLRGAADLMRKVQEVHRMTNFPPVTDPDLMIYTGGFFSDADRRTMDRLRGLAPEALAAGRFAFQDPRLPEMLLRYRARNWPQTLNEEEREHWEAFRRKRLTDPDGGGSTRLDGYRERLAELRAQAVGDAQGLGVLDELERWAEQAMDASG